MSHPQQLTPYSMSLAKSLTIDEMRALHRQAISEAEAKKTELKLVLASRYRELVGSSDEVLEMQRNAKALDELVASIPELVERLIECVNAADQRGESKEGDEISQSSSPRMINMNQEVKREKEGEKEVDSLEGDRLRLANAPLDVHTCLDVVNVHGSARTLIDTFAIVTKYTRQYPLANVLARVNHGQDFCPVVKNVPPQLMIQIKMIYLHLQSMPLRTIQMAKNVLLSLSGTCSESARALSAIHSLNVHVTTTEAQRANKLMDLYFESKAKAIHELLNRLSPKIIASHTQSPTKSKKDKNYYSEEATDAAEQTISNILLILQYDIVLYSYQIFMLREYETMNGEESVMQYLPQFDQEQLKMKVTHFLATHLPLIRSKVKTILVGIAGTTASRLGQMRQSLYDKTDGDECLRKLSSGVCSWQDATQVIDVEVVTKALEGLTTTTSTAAVDASSGGVSCPVRRFSLWGALFSNTFSSLVHSILSSAFHSVHRQVISSLKASLANAPPYRDMLPHEAYRNTLCIVTGLDKELKKVSDDAHELLVHAEEREESERRLKQSLYVQTCEIMGRLLNELRRMLDHDSSAEHVSIDEDEEATKQLILGRLCYFLKFRLASLPNLLNPDSSPAVVATKSGGKVGMISIAELQSAFEIADVDGDGLITFEEAIDAMEGAFSGTHFHGAEMLRDTMLVTSVSDGTDTNVSEASRTLTLMELALLSARGLKHAIHGPESALGTIQRMLNDLVDICFSKWARIAISKPLNDCLERTQILIDTACSVTDSEWRRLYLFSSPSEEQTYNVIEQEKSLSGFSARDVGSVSSFLVAFFISITSILNQCVSPSDSIQPLSSPSHAEEMGIDASNGMNTMSNLLRSSMVRESLLSLSRSIHAIIMTDADGSESGQRKIEKCCSSSLLQTLTDVLFISVSYFKEDGLDSALEIKVPVEVEGGLTSTTVAQYSRQFLGEMEGVIKGLLDNDETLGNEKYMDIIGQRQREVLLACDLFFTPLFGERTTVMQGVDSLSASSDFVDFGSTPLLVNPLPSSRRFLLLPIQAEQSIKELELLQNFEKERTDKVEVERTSAGAAAASAVSSSFGFFSSMLNKKK